MEMVFICCVVLGGAVYLTALFIVDKNESKRRTAKAQALSDRRSIADKIISTHISVLARKYDQLTFKDDYDQWVFDDWDRELDNFMVRMILPALPSLKVNEDEWFAIQKSIQDAVHVYQKEHPNEFGDFDENSDPLEYERLVAAALEEMGWDARLTTATGDQGADVIASKHGRRLVVQCKLYSKPVGNKAVQEVFAAKRHQGADFAAVVSNADYTKSARQLASTTSVFLLHHDELSSLDEALGMEGEA